MSLMEPKSYMVVPVFPVSRSALRTERVGVTPGSLGWKSEIVLAYRNPLSHTVWRRWRTILCLLMEEFCACVQYKGGICFDPIENTGSTNHVVGLQLS